MNEHDSENIAGILNAAGYQKASFVDEADVIVINTCCVRQSAENRIWGYLGSLKALKKQNPDLLLVACGCMMQQDEMAEKVFKKAAQVDIVLGTYALHRLQEYLARALSGEHHIVDTDVTCADLPPLLPSVRSHPLRAQVNISYGCDNYCSYCIVPYVRGPQTSRPFGDILAEVDALISDGVREVQLLGQNVNSYGKDLPGKESFASLLTAVAGREGLWRVRYMTSHPRDLSREVIDAVCASEKICRHFHLPLQSGSDRILKLMNRGYSTADYQRLVEYIRRYLPEATLTTDLIVGFPGETEDDVDATLAFVGDCNFDAAYTFLYSQRSGTAASEMFGQIDMAVKKERLQRLMSMQNEISLAKNKAMLGSCQQVLVEGPSKGNEQNYTGRNDGGKIIIFPATSDVNGTLVNVRITEAKTWYLSGVIE